MRFFKNRKLVFLFLDAFFIALSLFLAFLLRFDASIPQEYTLGTMQIMIFVLLAFCLPIFNSFGLYSFSWSYVSTAELISLFKALTFGFAIAGTSLLIIRELGIINSFPRSTVIISYFLIFIFSGGIRIAKKVYLDVFSATSGKVKILIVGAGDAGEQILRSVKSSRSDHYMPVGFVDDSPSKAGVFIHGLPVLGKIEDIPLIVKKKEIQELIIALPTAGTDTIRKAIELGGKSGVRNIKNLSIYDFINGRINLGNLKDVEAKDLLGRKPVEIDSNAVNSFIKGKTVLITGGAGSIGSELCRQVAKFNPSSLLVLDQDETAIFNIEKELKDSFPELNFNFIISDIQDKNKINKIFKKHNPDIVFHAAAYKHVPLMEEHYDEAIKNNVFGIEIVAQAAINNQVQKFVFISTDKAVNPTSVMGATKRIGEMICQAYNQKNHTKFVSVRFGNVLDSRGSVIPIFRERIKKREALQVTHPEMKRYFMLIPEACLLVLQAAEMGQGGEVFVLDMGEPVKILDLAKEMIKLSGLEPDKDIPIVFCGTRPGEKLFEEILTAEEGTIATKNQKIFIAKLASIDENILSQNISKLKDFLENNKNREEFIGLLKKIIPTYQGIDKI